MRAAILLTALMALPTADEPTAVPALPDITVIATGQLKALLKDNLDLRKAVLDAITARDAAIDGETLCVVGRST